MNILKSAYPMQHRKKIAIIYGPLLHYRVALFNALSNRYDLTVFTTDNRAEIKEIKFKVIEIRPLNFFVFDFQFGLRQKLLFGQFDACISFLNLRHINSFLAILIPVAPRMFCWGVWLTSSRLANFIRIFAIQRSEAALFYCDQHMKEVVEYGCDPEKLYVAPNTCDVIQVNKLSSFKSRDSIIFVGSLLPRKGIDRLLQLFFKAKLPEKIRLVILGDGPLRNSLLELIKEMGLEQRVEMPGNVTDLLELEIYYSRALLSVSLNQAGLSVLQSMGYGVPFLTIKGSISGGEINNITDNITGYFVSDNDDEIIKKLRHLIDAPGNLEVAGVAAQRHYRYYANIQNYAQGFYDMLENTRCTHVWNAKSC